MLYLWLVFILLYVVIPFCHWELCITVMYCCSYVGICPPLIKGLLTYLICHGLYICSICVKKFTCYVYILSCTVNENLLYASYCTMVGTLVGYAMGSVNCVLCSFHWLNIVLFWQPRGPVASEHTFTGSQKIKAQNGPYLYMLIMNWYI